MRPRILVLTGAGISRESGLATFRDADGIWAQVRIEEVATPAAFAADPARVHAFYNARRAQLESVAPNAAHQALAAFDAAWPGELLVVTQNVDDLHERAGSRRLLHMHGELRRARCTRCGARHFWLADLATTTPCPGCGAAGGLRPDIVWFGEVPCHLEEIGEALARCELFVAIGTSAEVYPAAGFVEELRGRARTVELNLAPTVATALFDTAEHGPASALVPRFFEALRRAHA